MPFAFSQAIIAALTGSIIGGIVNLLFWYGFNRREEKRDAEVRELKGEVRLLRDEKLVQLDHRLTKDHEAHGQLHEKINRLPDVFVTRRECALTCGESIEQIRKTQAGQAVCIQELSTGVAETRTVVGLIAERLEISLEGHREPS